MNKALKLTRKLKHMAGKHSQQAHAGKGKTAPKNGGDGSYGLNKGDAEKLNIAMDEIAYDTFNLSREEGLGREGMDESQAHADLREFAAYELGVDIDWHYDHSDKASDEVMKRANQLWDDFESYDE